MLEKVVESWFTDSPLVVKYFQRLCEDCRANSSTVLYHTHPTNAVMEKVATNDKAHTAIYDGENEMTRKVTMEGMMV